MTKLIVTAYDAEAQAEKSRGTIDLDFYRGKPIVVEVLPTPPYNQVSLFFDLSAHNTELYADRLWMDFPGGPNATFMLPLRVEPYYLTILHYSDETMFVCTPDRPEVEVMAASFRSYTRKHNLCWIGVSIPARKAVLMAMAH